MDKFPFEDRIMALKEGEEDVIHINGKSFVIVPATENDVERIEKGFFVMD